MRARVFSALLLLFSLSLHAQSVSVWPAQTFTGDSTGVVMQLNSIQSVGSAASGVLTLVGTSLTTVTFAVQASTDGGLNYFAIPVYLVASPTTAAATSITATASAQYGINLAGVTHLKIVTSGTFTATSVSFQLATSPNGSVAKGATSGGTCSGCLIATNNLSDVSNAGTSRGNLGAAAKGANSDITSLAGLATPLSSSQGGTGNVLGALFSTPNIIQMFGDSITAGTGVASITSSYANLVGANYLTYFNNAASGAMAADLAWTAVYNSGITPAVNSSYNGSTIYTFMIGTNDANLDSQSSGAQTAGRQNNYYHALMAATSFAGIPNQYRINAQNAECTTTGTWTSTTLDGYPVLQSIVPGSTLSCPSLTSGDAAVYAAWYAKDTFTSTATFSVDGISVDTWNAFGYNGKTISTTNGVTQTFFGNRYPLSGSGPHVYLVTVGTAGTGNPFTVAWMGSPTPATPSIFGNITKNAPRVVVGGVPYQNGNSASSYTSTYNSLASSLAAQLASDGILSQFVNVRNYVNFISDMSGSNTLLANGITCTGSTNVPLHPGTCGHLHLADAFLGALLPVTSPFHTNLNLSVSITATEFISNGTGGTDFAAENLNGATVSTCTVPGAYALIGKYWTGASSQSNTETFTSTCTPGTNGAETLTLANSGSTGPFTWSVLGNNQATSYSTTSNCAAVGTSASPSLATCGSAAAGAFSCDVTASNATCTVADTAVTANSEISVSLVSDESTRLGVTCNTAPASVPLILLATKTAATGFTVNVPTITTNPACFDFNIVN